MLGAAGELPDPGGLVCQVAVSLGAQGTAGLPAALALVVDAAGARSAVVRRAGSGELLAVAGDVVLAVPPAHTPRSAVVALPVAGADGSGVATVTVTGARPAALHLLRAVVPVLALGIGPASGAAGAGPDPAALVADLEAERDLLAGLLHDGPVQELLAARYAVELAARTGDASGVQECLQNALTGLRRSMWLLRSRGGDGLDEALRALCGRLQELGLAPLRLRLDPAAGRLEPVAATTAYRLVQAVALADTADTEPVRVTLERGPVDRQRVVLLVEGGGALPDPARWRRRAAAVSGDLLVAPGRVCLSLPVAALPTAAAAAPRTAAATPVAAAAAPPGTAAGARP